jgi:hypothetical protein
MSGIYRAWVSVKSRRENKSKEKKGQHKVLERKK